MRSAKGCFGGLSSRGQMDEIWYLSTRMPEENKDTQELGETVQPMRRMRKERRRLKVGLALFS
jgi:hypothetical protein